MSQNPVRALPGPLLKAGYSEKGFNAGEVRLNYAHGPRNGMPLVLIPGQSMPWESYTRVLPKLAKRFEVFAVDVRGHGGSGWTTGHYSFNAIGRDFTAFFKGVVGRPALVSGQSSGGVVAFWLAANASEHVAGILPEDPPIFGCEWPRLRDDLWAHKLFEHCIKLLLKPEGRDLGSFFSGLEIPVGQGQRVMKFPQFLASWIGNQIRKYQEKFPGQPVDLWFLPLHLRLWIRSLSQYDPDFTRAFVDGSACDFDHAEALSRIHCPVYLLHADWFRHQKLGLVGALDDQDAERVRSLCKDFQYLRVRGGHMIHLERPDTFVRAVEDLAQRVMHGSEARAA